MENILRLPTSNDCMLPEVLSNLECQVKALAPVLTATTSGNEAKMKQQIVARLTASVFVAFSAVGDAGLNAVYLAINAPLTLFKVTVGSLIGFDKSMSEVLCGAELARLSYKVYASTVLAFVAILVGTVNPGLVVTNGRELGLMNFVQIGTPRKNLL